MAKAPTSQGSQSVRMSVLLTTPPLLYPASAVAGAPGRCAVAGFGQLAVGPEAVLGVETPEQAASPPAHRRVVLGGGRPPLPAHRRPPPGAARVDAFVLCVSCSPPP